MGAFQIHDEFVRTSLYKRASHLIAIELKGPAAEHVGTVRAALPSRTELNESERHDHTHSGANPNVVWLVAGSALLGLGLAILWSPSFVDQTIGKNGATTILGDSAVLALVFVAIAAVGRGRLLRWLAARPDRIIRFNAIALLAAGTFLIAYWCVRLPAVFGIGWWPRVPWS